MFTPPEPRPLDALRRSRWSELPKSPGVYWWYFPESDVAHLRIRELCEVSSLRLRFASDGKLCLYHGLANNLAQRIAWHAEQRLTQGALKSGFLSTFRLTLLALNGYDYSQGSERIDRYFDGLSVSWQTTRSREEAREAEHAELQGSHHYPLNIQGNGSPDLQRFIEHLKRARKAYRLKHST